MRAIDALDHLISLARRAERAQVNAAACGCADHQHRARQAEEDLEAYAVAFQDALLKADKERDARGLDPVCVSHA